MTCTQPGCTGTIAADGYCDTCGAPAAPAPGGNPAGPVPGAAPVSPRCGQPGCGGAIASDGYCDRCGHAASPAASGSISAPPTGGSHVAPPSMASIAAPSAPGTSARLAGGSRRTSSSRRTGATRTAVGAGLVEVMATPLGDPSKAIMSSEKIASVLGAVPEEKRVCTTCGKPVGRSADGRSGRVTGFCGSCRTQFNFVTNAPALAAGDLVAGQYEILGPLAHGGLGWIYLGRDKAVSDRWVVLKGLLNADDPDAVAAAVAERQFLAQIEHAKIVNIYNFVTSGGAGYIVMEYVGGQSLNDKLKKRREANGGRPDPLPPTEAIAYLLSVLPAFQYLHNHGLVYNDLKPANVMAVGDDVKLIDLGAVMKADDVDAAIFGTQGFQGPEVSQIGPSAQSDLYTVGRTLAVLMLNFVFHTGPFETTLPSPAEEPLFAQWESLYRFLLRSTAAHPDDRFQSADEMGEQLLGVLREIVAVSEGVPRPAASALFTGDGLPALLADNSPGASATSSDWRVLPAPKVDPSDQAAAFLINLPHAEPASVRTMIDRAVEAGQIQRTREVQLRSVRAAIEGGAGAGTTDPWIVQTLQEIEAEDPWDWRVAWYRGLAALVAGRWTEAADQFSLVWTELAGELAPKLAVAIAAERAGELERAAHIYERVVAVDNTFVSASFGLARCRALRGDRAGAAVALAQVPNSSSTYVDAQVATARTMADARSAAPSAEELAAAATTVERLSIDAKQRATLAAEILERALAGVHAGSLAPGSGPQLFGNPIAEPELRSGLEQTYRELARLAPTDEERIRLVDQANAIRPRSLV